MTNKERFLSIVSEECLSTLEDNKKRIKNREMLRRSQIISLNILMRLDDLSWTKGDLALSMGITEKEVSKIVSGKENIDIETIIKLQNILNVEHLDK